MFLVFPREDFVANVKYAKHFQQAFDRHPEKALMKSPVLGHIWYEKKEFVKRAMLLFPNELFFIWCDIGILRDATCLQAYADFGKRIETMPHKFHILELKTCPSGSLVQGYLM